MDKVAVVIRCEDKVLLVKNEDAGEWSPIVSEVERGETFREAARRRTTSVVDAGIEFVEKIDREDVEGGERIHWYLATEEEATEENTDPDQVEADSEDLEWFSIEELDDLELEGFSRKFFQDFTGSLVE
jgi:ADP-ribose pyrophosphatase YjhB (NUDIX family)